MLRPTYPTSASRVGPRGDAGRTSAREHSLPRDDLGAFRASTACVTGGMGFIGSNLTHRLVSLGCHVRVVDCLDEAQGANEFNLAPIQDKVQWLRVDVRDLDAMRAAVTDCDFVFHLAGRNSHLGSVEAPFEDLDINGRGTLSVLEAVRMSAPQARVIHAGSRSEYGVIRRNPVGESHVLEPTEPNSASKAISTLYQSAYHHAFGIHTVSLRLTNIYGPRMCVTNPRLGFINWFVGQALQGAAIQVYGEGSQLRDVLYIDDCVNAFVLAATATSAKGRVYNIGSGSPVSVKDVADELERLGAPMTRYTPFPEDAKRIEIGDFIADTRAARTDLGWASSISLADGVQKTLEFFSKHKSQYLT